MSKQDDQSMQSFPVDENEPQSSQQQTGGEHVADAAGQNGSNLASDPASADQPSVTEASEGVARGQTSSASTSAEPTTATSSSSTATAAGSSTSATAGALGASGSAAGTAAAGIPPSVIAAIVAAVVVVVAIVIGIVVTQQNTVDEGNWYDNAAQKGQFEGKSKEEIQDALNEEVAKGMMNISIAAVVNFPAGSTEGEARIENIAANPMDQKITIALKDSDEVVYESGAIAPDQHIQTITLTKALAPGDHAAVATFTGYDRETHKETGKAAAEIVLHVEG